MPHAVIILADGFEEVEAVTCIDLLRRAGITVTVLGLSSHEVRGTNGIIVKADALFEEFSESFDAVILPGGMPGTNNLAASESLLSFIRSAHDSGKLCAAICAAPIVFAKAGILENRKATCYPGCEAKLSGALFVNDDVVVDFNIITGRALGSAILFALEIIEALAGEKDAVKIGMAILYL